VTEIVTCVVGSAIGNASSGESLSLKETGLFRFFARWARHVLRRFGEHGALPEIRRERSRDTNPADLDVPGGVAATGDQAPY
jgi:hypothetical protein